MHRHPQSSRLGAFSLAILLGFGGVATAYADTPCDALRSYLKDELRKSDRGLDAALERLEARPDGKVGEHCADLSRALPGIDVDESELEAGGDIVCRSDFDFYHERSAGGFVLLMGPGGGMGSGCTDAMFLLIGAGHAQPSGSWEACLVASTNPQSLHALRLNGALYAATVEEIVEGMALRYAVTLSDARQTNCGLSVTYELHYVVQDWFGPRGRDDISASLQAAVAPILIEQAMGGDGRQASAGLRDQAAGDSRYDRFLRKYPERPIAMDSGSIFDELGEGLDVYFALDDFGNPNVFDQFDHADLMPLRIDGRRYLLTFGHPIFGYRVARDPAFGLLEWTGSEFTPIAGGYLAKAGENPIVQ